LAISLTPEHGCLKFHAMKSLLFVFLPAVLIAFVIGFLAGIHSTQDAGAAARKEVGPGESSRGHVPARKGSAGSQPAEKAGASGQNPELAKIAD
jgi:hypothetical protein